jgi:hypothetical protein
MKRRTSDRFRIDRTARVCAAGFVIFSLEWLQTGLVLRCINAEIGIKYGNGRLITAAWGRGLAGLFDLMTLFRA